MRNNLLLLSVYSIGSGAIYAMAFAFSICGFSIRCLMLPGVLPIAAIYGILGGLSTLPFHYYYLKKTRLGYALPAVFASVFCASLLGGQFRWGVILPFVVLGAALYISSGVFIKSSSSFRKPGRPGTLPGD